MMSTVVKHMSDNPPGFACKNRVSEWIAAACMLLLAISVQLTPGLLNYGDLRYLLYFDGNIFAGLLIFLAVARVSALYFNGRGLPWSARVRAACALAGSIIFGFVSISLLALTPETGFIAPGAGPYLILAVAELYSVTRAAADVHDPPSRKDE